MEQKYQKKYVTIVIHNGTFKSEHSMLETSYLDILKEFRTIEKWLITLVTPPFTVEVIK